MPPQDDAGNGDVARSDFVLPAPADDRTDTDEENRETENETRLR